MTIPSHAEALAAGDFGGVRALQNLDRGDGQEPRVGGGREQVGHRG